MSKPPLPDHVQELLAKPNPAVIAALRPGGQPVSVATWYLFEDGQVLVNMDEARRRLDYLRRDPRVSMTILDGNDWYTHVSVQGGIARIEEDLDLVMIDRMSQHYRGRRYDKRNRKRFNAWIEIDTWHGWGAVRDDRVGGG